MSNNCDSITLTLSKEDVDRINKALEEKAIRKEANGSYEKAEPYMKTRDRIDQQFHGQHR